jgi:DNA-binding transcriptional ArsR family regulator
MSKALLESEKMLTLVARRFRLLGEPFRLRLLHALERGERTVGELVRELEGNQPNVSKHLQMLNEAGLVSRRREGNSIYYGIANPMVLKLCELVCQDARERAREEYLELDRPGRGRR